MATLNGSLFDDTIQGTDADEVINGLGGDDDLFGFDGFDTIYGGDGSDSLGIGYNFTGGRASQMYGGDGDDDFGGGLATDLSYGGDGNDFFGLSGGNDSIFGGTGTDVLTLYAFNRGVDFTLAAGGTGTVTIRTADNLGFTGVTKYTGIEGLIGGGFDDTLHGNSADNVIYGEYGADILYGLAGDDALNGGNGHDTLTGGKGSDAFVFLGDEDRRLMADTADVLTDFDPTADKLVFFSRNFTGLRTASDAPDGTMTGTPLFALLASEFAVQTTRFAATIGVRLIYDRDDGLLYYDADGALSGYRPRLIADIGHDLALTAGDIFIY